MLGYDTLFINPIEDRELVRIAREEGRVLISGDRAIFKRKDLKSGAVKGHWVDSYQNHLLQLRKITETFRGGEYSPFIRCIECNTPLLPKEKEAAEGKVPPYVYRTVKSYAYCPACDQFFWEGDHVKRMRDLIELL